MNTPRLGVLGGTFDPIHYGHLQLAEMALDQFHLDRILFIPTGTPPHKIDRPVTTARDRFTMTVLATSSNPCFDVLPVEIDRKGRSYSVDTLVELHSIYGPGAELFFILGADAVLEMHTWKDPARVIELCRIVVAARPGIDLTRLEDVPVAGLCRRVEPLEELNNSISSTSLRESVAEGLSIRYLTPEPVVSYIHKRGLYRSSGTPALPV